MGKQSNKNPRMKNLFKNAINKTALKKACNDPEFIAIIKKIKY